MAILMNNRDCVQYLISKGAALQTSPETCQAITPLAAAVSREDERLVQYLLDAGANPCDPHALEAAVDNLRLFQLLLRRAERTAALWRPKEIYWGRLALDKAIMNVDHAVAETLLRSHVVDIYQYCCNYAVLYEALEHDSSSDLAIARLVIAHGADPDSLVHNALFKEESALFVAVRKESLGKVELLLDAGADPDSYCQVMKMTPLQLALMRNRGDIAKLLLERGADPNTFSCRGAVGTAIQTAVAAKDTESVRLLLHHKARPDLLAGKLPHTALQMAAQNGCKEIVDILIEHGANVNAPAAENCGATALQFAAIQGYLSIAYVLLENRADVNAPRGAVGGRKALEGAAEHGRIDMVQMLLNAGADIHGEGREQYERALAYASGNGHHATRRLLESYHG